MVGIVESFGAKKGFGFIKTDNDRYWFHASEWMGRDKPKPGDKVDFMPLDTERGKRAYIVSKVRR